MADIARSIEAQPLTAERVGALRLAPRPPTPIRPTAPSAWSSPGTTSICNVISHAPDEIARTDGGLLCDGLYRHDTHTQALLTLDVPCGIAVAPADVDFADAG